MYWIVWSTMKSDLPKDSPPPGTLENLKRCGPGRHVGRAQVFQSVSNNETWLGDAENTILEKGNVLPDDTLQKKKKRGTVKPTAHPAEWMVGRWNVFPFWGKKKQAYFSAGAQGTLSLEPKFLGRFGRTTNYIEDSKTMNPGSWIVMEFSFQNWVLLSACVLLKDCLSPGAEKNCQCMSMYISRYFPQLHLTFCICFSNQVGRCHSLLYKKKFASQPREKSCRLPLTP